jgi:hypothetical protein
MLRVICSHGEVLDFFHCMMMVCYVAVIVDGCLVDLNSDSEVISTGTLSMTSIDVVLFSFC